MAQEYPEVALEEEVAEYVLPDVEVPHHFPPAPPQVMINLEVSRIPLHAISAGRGWCLPTKTFICEECGKSFKDKNYIKLHKRSHSGEKPHPCEDCGKSFTTSTNLILHKKIHSEERPFPCNQCDKSFKILPSLKDHIVRCHVVKDPMYEGKVIEDDTEKFPCDRCPKYLTTKHSLKVHQLTHTGEKAFACDQCEKSFSLKFNLQVHQRRHLEEKSVHCKSCDKSFTTTAGLYNHKWKKVNGVKTSKCQ